MTNLRNWPRSSDRIPGSLYLWLAILIFGAASAVTRKLTEIGAQHVTNGQNPISLCNVLFVGNLCALLVLVPLYQRQLSRATLRQLSRREWLSLISVAILAGAIAPAVMFQALALTPVNNVILVGRLEPPLTLALSIWFLRERVHRWEVLGAIIAFIGVTLTILLQPPQPGMMQVGMLRIGLGEGLATGGAIAATVATVISRKYLSRVSLGLYSIVRTGLGTVIFFVTALMLYGRQHFAEALSPFLWQWMLLYGLVIVVIGQLLWLKGLRASTVSIATLVSSFTPIVGILAAYWILHEAPTPAQYIGGSVILMGLLLGQLGRQRQTAQTASPALTDPGMGFRGI